MQPSATAVALQSREAVHNHNKEAWLALFAEDGVIEDPIGPSHLDPTGKGHRTPAEREAFWDNNIANSEITITINQSYAAGNECANVVTLVLKFEHEGQRYTQEINGVFTYAVNESNQLTALRGYWDTEEAAATMRPVAE